MDVAEWEKGVMTVPTFKASWDSGNYQFMAMVLIAPGVARQGNNCNPATFETTGLVWQGPKLIMYEVDWTDAAQISRVQLAAGEARNRFMRMPASAYFQSHADVESVTGVCGFDVDSAAQRWLLIEGLHLADLTKLSTLAWQQAAEAGYCRDKLKVESEIVDLEWPDDNDS